jgi:hypothetical protein
MPDSPGARRLERRVCLGAVGSRSGANVALTLSAWPTREECASDQARKAPSYKPKTGETIRLVCFPDTVDPREPKAK